MKTQYTLEIGKFKNIEKALEELRRAIANEELAFPLPGDEPTRMVESIKELESLCSCHIEALRNYSQDE